MQVVEFLSVKNGEYRIPEFIYLSKPVSKRIKQRSRLVKSVGLDDRGYIRMQLFPPVLYFLEFFWRTLIVLFGFVDFFVCRWEVF